MRIAIAFAALVLTISLAVYSYPASAACVFVNGNVESEAHQNLLKDARARIESKFGSMSSQPVVYFFEREADYWSLRLNPYGSTSFLGYKTCIAIGPQGQNIDVVAHELMHAEIEERAGFWARATIIPVWFDEGLAMQVDFRERYDLRSSQESEYVTKLFSDKEFFSAKGNDLTQNYAAAKSEVNQWLSRSSVKSVFEKLSKLKRGSSFDSIWNNPE